jgi:hypothetical protein
MARQRQEYRKLTREELDALAGEELPERAVMSLLRANVAIPMNAPTAAHVLSDGSILYAEGMEDDANEQRA